MLKLIAKAGVAVLSTVVLVSGAAAQTPSAFSAQEFAAVMNKLPAPNAQNGKEVHAKLMCGGCHGAEGIAQMKNWPHVAGQPREATIKSLLDYRDGRRAQGASASMMAGAAKLLNDQQIVDVALFYEELNGPDGTKLSVGKEKNAPKLEADVARLITRGDSSRAITPCAVCHGTTSAGNINEKVPVLHGQNPTYLIATLKEYRSAERRSDILKEMRFFAQQLSDKEIEQISVYYGDLAGRKGK